MSIQHLLDRKLSPGMIAGLAVLFVVAGSLALALRTSAVDPRVRLEQGRGSSDQRLRLGAATGVATTMDGEVACTADRIGEATALALSASLYAATEQLNRRTPRGVRDLIIGVAQKGLLPPGLTLTNTDGTLASASGAFAVRYRPAPLGIEVVSIAGKPEHGPALIVRLPDETSDKGEARLYLAGRLQGMTVPAPFAPAAEVIALGWSPERLRSLK